MSGQSTRKTTEGTAAEPRRAASYYEKLQNARSRRAELMGATPNPANLPHPAETSAPSGQADRTPDAEPELTLAATPSPLIADDATGFHPSRAMIWGLSLLLVILLSFAAVSWRSLPLSFPPLVSVTVDPPLPLATGVPASFVHVAGIESAPDRGTTPPLAAPSPGRDPAAPAPAVQGAIEPLTPPAPGPGGLVILNTISRPPERPSGITATAASD